MPKPSNTNLHPPTRWICSVAQMLPRFLAKQPPQPAALRSIWLCTADPAFRHILCIPPPPAPNQPLAAEAPCCDVTPDFFPLSPFPSCPRRQISPLILESPYSWCCQENPGICFIFQEVEPRCTPQHSHLLGGVLVCRSFLRASRLSPGLAGSGAVVVILVSG